MVIIHFKVDYEFSGVVQDISYLHPSFLDERSLMDACDVVPLVQEDDRRSRR